jgi:hypothetical protein
MDMCCQLQKTKTELLVHPVAEGLSPEFQI